MADKSKNENLAKLIREEVPDISGNKARKIVRLVQQQVSIRTGPYPAPEDYEHYLDIDEDLVSQIKEMTKAEQVHQHDLDRKDLDQSFVLRKRGQWFGFAIFFLALVLGGVIVYLGNPWPGALLSGSSLAAIIIQYLKS